MTVWHASQHTGGRFATAALLTAAFADVRLPPQNIFGRKRGDRRIEGEAMILLFLLLPPSSSFSFSSSSFLSSPAG